MEKRLNIVKVQPATNETAALSTQQLFDRQKAFPKMPQLYLELLENKEKIKQTLVGKEFDPTETLSEVSYFHKAMPAPTPTPSTVRPVETTAPPPPPPPTPMPSRPRVVQQETSSWASSVDDEEGDDEDHGGDDDGGDDVDDDDALQEDDSDGGETVWEDDFQDGGGAPTTTTSYGAPPQQGHEAQRRRYDAMLGVAPTMSAAEQPQMSGAGTTTHAPPPRLSELERMGQLRGASTSKPIYPDLARLQNKDSDEEDEIKRELLFKFDLLRKGYKDVQIPEFSMNTDVRHLSRAYENTLRRVTLDNSVETYKSYMVGGFMLTEFVIQQWMQIDMQGFTKQQLINMTQYERLFIEMGEKSYRPGGSPWPVEVRILTTVLVNAAIFAVSKMILKKTGSDMMNFMGRGMAGASSASSSGGMAAPSAADAAPKRKMQGPSIDLQDLPDI